MPNLRKYTDDQLRCAVAGSTTWADVLEKLGKKRGGSAVDVQKVAAELGLNLSHFDYRRSRRPVTASALPFGRPATPDHRSSLAIAARWFLDRQYIASVPLEVAPYDLVVESDEGLKRIQVKSTSFTPTTGRYPTVKICRRVYDPTSSTVGSKGRVRDIAYTEAEVDMFFIVTSDGPLYLIPLTMVTGLMALSLGPKYENYRVG